jgi:hypothetical protein
MRILHPSLVLLVALAGLGCLSCGLTSPRSSSSLSESGTAEGISAILSASAEDDSSSSPTARPATAPPEVLATTLQVPEGARCIVKSAVVMDRNPPLHVRSQPVVNANNIVGTLQNGVVLKVATEQPGWFQIQEPIEGWVAKPLVDYACSRKTERLRLLSDRPQNVRDRFVGAGTHYYLISAKAGQTLTIIKNKGRFPLVLSPTGRVLVSKADIDQRMSWTQQLSEPGDYALEILSEGDGYAYSLSVSLSRIQR